MQHKAQICRYATVLMGSPVQLTLLQHNQSLAARTFRLIKQYEDLLTVNRTHSQVVAINHAAGEHPVVVCATVFALIKCARAVSVRENSAFNLAIGPLVRRWRIGFNGDCVPPADEIAALLGLTAPEEVLLDEQARTVFLTRKGMEIDLGAIAKGYIADRIRDYLRAEGVCHAMINLGGNIQTLGAPQNGWSIGLKKPFAAADALLATINVADRSMVTSGIYERYFMQDGRCYHHILDPRTGYPLDNELESVTIISADSLDGDIWTTLIYGLGIVQGYAALQTRPDIEAVFVTRDRRVVLSSARQFDFTLLEESGYRLVELKDSTLAGL